MTVLPVPTPFWIQKLMSFVPAPRPQGRIREWQRCLPETGAIDSIRGSRALHPLHESWHLVVARSTQLLPWDYQIL